ncbi:translation initiation factor eif-2b epsilon [Niveomyces insectorum RCEF 264]|uniref:Mannose-1-phosphate guanyltransferase n=1 Tax=Niveomyces insectorum RCEF 264 TaxID=1081102 RepID=A0A167PRW5_9HYPO|nr:translation initiation factor eif-2b epsilon [Niveomyces insectorum RCEF 264]
MAQAGKKGGGARGKKAGGGKGPADEQGDDVLQAVVLADSFQDRFKPFTLDKPRCLLPLANTPLIEYTLEYLAANGVHDVVVYCGAHADQIEAYLAASPRWAPTSPTNPFQALELIRVAQATSLGDFLRDLDKRGRIAGDFVLVHGDLVANVPLDPVLARHRARRLANRDAIMTLVLREAGVDGGADDENDANNTTHDDDDDHHHRTRAHGIEPLFVLDAATGRCLDYSEMTPLDHRADRRLAVDPAFLEPKTADLALRADLIDCGIDICTPDVLALWTESFDCELPRRNFLHNVLKDWELNGKQIYADIITDAAAATTTTTTATTATTATTVGHYAARVTNLASYDAVSRDVLGRWTYPYVPDSNLVPGHSYSRNSNYTRHHGNRRRNVVAERGVIIAADAAVTNAVLGLHTTVGAGSIVAGSTLGRRCRIGANVRITDCYLWDDVVVGDNTVLTRSVLASGVHVGRGCVLPAGALLSFGVAVGDNVRPAVVADTALKTTTTTTTPLTLSLLAPDGSRVADDAAVVGADGKGAVFSYTTGSDDEEDNDYDTADSDATRAASLQRSLVYSTAHLNLSTSSISSFESDGAFGGSDDDDNEVAVVDDDDDDAAGRTNANAKNTLTVDRAARGRGGGGDDTRSRLSSFASLEHAGSGRWSTSGKRGAARFVHDVAVGGGGSGTAAEQVEFVLALQRTLVGLRRQQQRRRRQQQQQQGGPTTTTTTTETTSGTPAPGTLLAALLQQLYDNDVLEEEGILAWWGDKRATWDGPGGDSSSGEGNGDNDADNTMAGARARCRVLVEWLETAEEDDSEDEEDGDDDDDDEEEEDSEEDDA